MTAVLISAGLAAGAIGILVVVRRVVGPWRWSRGDAVVDALIESNHWLWCEEHGQHGSSRPMDRPDWDRINQIADRRWRDLTRAQRRGRRPTPRAVAFRRRSA